MSRRETWWPVATVALCVALVFIVLGTGPLPVAAGDVVANVLGDAPQYDFAVQVTGLPPALLGIVVGACFGAAGALVQSLTRNPLGSPDIIGFDVGAATGALVGITLLGVSGSTVSLMAAGGGLVTALGVFALAGGAGDGGYRLILIGIGAGSALAGVNAYLLTRSSPQTSLAGARWMVGSLNEATWREVQIGTLVLIVLLPLAVLLGRSLRVMELGRSTAVGLGVRLELVQTSVIAVSVVLAATAVSLTGPITFVALAAPHITNRIIRRPGPLVVASAGTGAALMITSHFLALRAFGDDTIPVGVVTGVLGGVYLAWLLTREWRR